MIVASKALSLDELKNTVVAIPGKLTSAFLELNLWWTEQFGNTDDLKYEVVPFDEIIPSIQQGKYQAGLIIHEGQLTYKKDGMELIADMGVWWKDKTGLPLPLGVNVVRKDLGPEVVADVSRCMRESITAGLSNRPQGSRLCSAIRPRYG